MKENIDTFKKFKYTLSKNSLLIAICIAMCFEGLRLFNIFPPSELIVRTTFLLIIVLSILYILLIKSKIKLLYLQLSAFFIIITYIVFQTALVSYHKFLPIWIDFSIIIAFIIMDRKYSLLISVYSFLGIIFINFFNEYDLDFFSFFTLLFSIVVFSILGYIISVQLQKYETENQFQKEKLKKLALIDELTQIFNRRAFFEISNKVLKQADRENKKIAVLMCDIDFFKQVNDKYGHEAGDEVLKEVANIIKDSIRENDIIARIGGEEFAILLYDIDENGAMKVANKILKTVRKHIIVYKKESINITISIGVYCPIEKIDINETIKDFLFKADKALYEVKNRGRNKVICYQE